MRAHPLFLLLGLIEWVERRIRSDDGGRSYILNEWAMNGKGTLQVSKNQVEGFCRKWKVAELHLFGSVLRDDFGPESDVDVLVTFLPGAPWGLLDLVRMERELSQLFGRKVDLVERPAVEHSENYLRRERILSSLEPLYVAG